MSPCKPCLECLPDNILHIIFSLIEIEQLNIARSICRRIHAGLSQKEFLEERKYQETSQEILVVVGGKQKKLGYPSRYGKKTNNKRMEIEDNAHRIIGWVPSLYSWRRFGSHSFLDRVVDYQVVQVNTSMLVFLGGSDKDYEGEAIDEVWAYSFATNEFEQWPSMLRKRTKDSFQACAVGDCIVVTDIADNLRCDCISYTRSEHRGKQCDIYNMNSRMWTKACVMPRLLDGAGAAVTHGRYMFLPRQETYSCRNCGSQCQESMGGLAYDLLEDKWRIMPTHPVPGKSSSTVAFRDNIFVIGGFYNKDATITYGQHHEIIEYEDHLDHVRVFDTSLFEWKEDNCFPRLPNPVRGASICVYNGRLTLTGGLSSFNSAHMFGNGRTILQLFEEDGEWKEMDFQLPLSMPALIDGHTFAIVV